MNSSRTGTCGKCKVQVLQGKVKVEDGGPTGLCGGTVSFEEAEEGVSLMCSTYPRGDLYVLTHGFEHILRRKDMLYNGRGDGGQ